MKLRFWPFDGARRRFEKERDQDHDERLAGLRLEFLREEYRQKGLHNPNKSREVLAIDAPGDAALDSNPATCSKCGGLFIASKLQHRFVVRFFSERGSISEPEVKKEDYCAACLPTSNLEIILMNDRGLKGVLDTLYLSTKEGFLQPFDFQGVEQTLIDADEYGLLYCGDCDDLVHPSKNRKCRKCVTADLKKK